MGNVVIDMSMSLDGYIAAPNDIRSRGWARKGCGSTTGHSTILRCSSRCYGSLLGDRRRDHGSPVVRQLDRGVGWEGPAWRGSVLRRHTPAIRAGEPDVPFVTDGIESALAKAREAAAGNGSG